MKNKTLYYLTAALLLFVAIFIRFYKLGQVPVSLYWDETAILLDAKTLATNGMDMHGNGWLQTMFPSYGDYKLPVYIWMAGISVKLLGVTEFALRLPSALAGVGSVIVVGLLGYELAKIIDLPTAAPKRRPNSAILTGLWAAGIMAVTPWSVLFSRTGFEGHLGQFLAALSVYLALKAAQKKWLLIFSVALGGLATYTYFSVRFVWPLVFSFFWLLPHIHSLIQKTAVKNWLTKNAPTLGFLALSLVGYLILLQPMFHSPLYAASNQFRLSTTSVLNAHDYAVESNILREQAGNSFIDRVIFHRHWLMIRELLKNYADNLDPNYLFISGDPNLRHGTGSHGVLLLPTLPLLLLGFYQLAKKNSLVLAGLLGWWVIALLPASVPETTPHALRSLNAVVPVVLIMGMGGSLLLRKCVEWQRAGTLFLIGYCATILISFFGFAYHYFTIYPAQSAYDWQDGYKQLVTEILENKSSVRTVWVDPSEDRFYLWLLAYGPYTAEEIQALPKTEYKVTQVENVVFKGFEWSKLESLDHQAMVVGQPHDVEEKVSHSQVVPALEIPVYGQDGTTERYRAVLYKPNL